jgi:hypothetical protein
MDATNIKKLGVKPGYTILIVNAPQEYLADIAELPENARLVETGETPVDVAQLFVRSRAEVDTLVAEAMRSVKPGGLLWTTYPKRGTGIQTDIHRDSGWDSFKVAGWEGVVLVAIAESGRSNNLLTSDFQA